MKKYFIIVFLVLINLNLFSQLLKPIEKSIGRLNISIDPQIELLSVIQVLADYKWINKEVAYSKEIETFFNPFSHHEVVKLTKELSKIGFTFELPPTFMIIISNNDGITQNIPYSKNMINICGGYEKIEKYRIAIEKFAIESNFKIFWNNHLEYYTKIIDLSCNSLDKNNIVKSIEDYFNESKYKYSLIIAPLFNGCNYATKINVDNNKVNIYSFTSPDWVDKNSIPILSKSNLNVAIHEFSHSFVNPLTHKYIDTINFYKNLYEPISNKMKRNAYFNWEECVNEHIINAVNIRIQCLTDSSVDINKLIDYNKNKGFVYIEPVINRLIQYEKQKAVKNITFSDFYPQFITVFDSINNANKIIGL